MLKIFKLIGRPKQIFQINGFLSLLRQQFSLLTRGYFFQHGQFYLYEYNLNERNEADFLPKIENFTLNIIYSNQQADELVRNGFDDFRSKTIEARQGLDKGAIAFCVFIERVLAHTGWIAMNEEAKNIFDPLPFKVDFSNGEACTGGAWTNPKYRGSGLMSYVFIKRLQFLRGRGIAVLRCSVSKNNIAPQRLHTNLDATIYAEASYLKLLWWQTWKEKPLSFTSL